VKAINCRTGETEEVTTGQLLEELIDMMRCRWQSQTEHEYRRSCKLSWQLQQLRGDERRLGFVLDHAVAIVNSGMGAVAHAAQIAAISAGTHLFSRCA
jgi:hypothetical protein